MIMGAPRDIVMEKTLVLNPSRMNTRNDENVCILSIGNTIDC